jgi:hypothetical protein
MMCLAIDNPGSCEIYTIICLYLAKSLRAVEIHCELWVVYGQNLMSEGTVRLGCRIFIDGRKNVRNEEQSDWTSSVSENPLQSVDQKICERWRFTISELLCEFPQISCTGL